MILSIVASVSIEVAEGVGVVKFVLLKTDGALGPVSVQITTQDGTATGIVHTTTSLSCYTSFFIQRKVTMLGLMRL